MRTYIDANHDHDDYDEVNENRLFVLQLYLAK